MTALFVAGAHTDIGKTHVACALLRAARARRLTVDAFKPVMSGFDPAQAGQSDAGRLLAAMGRPLEDLPAVSPWRFAAPVAPPLAARMEGASLLRTEVASACRAWLGAGHADLRLVEGAGGLMSPLSDDGLNLDLMTDLGLPVILVGGAYLGAISHTLTALEVLKRRGLAIGAVVVSQDADTRAPDFADTVSRVSAYAGTPTLAASRLGEAWAEGLLDCIGPVAAGQP